MIAEKERILKEMIEIKWKLGVITQQSTQKVSEGELLKTRLCQLMEEAMQLEKRQ